MSNEQRKKVRRLMTRKTTVMLLHALKNRDKQERMNQKRYNELKRQESMANKRKDINEIFSHQQRRENELKNYIADIKDRMLNDFITEYKQSKNKKRIEQVRESKEFFREEEMQKKESDILELIDSIQEEHKNKLIDEQANFHFKNYSILACLDKKFNELLQKQIEDLTSRVLNAIEKKNNVLEITKSFDPLLKFEKQLSEQNNDLRLHKDILVQENKRLEDFLLELIQKNNNLKTKLKKCYEEGDDNLSEFSLSELDDYNEEESDIEEGRDKICNNNNKNFKSESVSERNEQKKLIKSSNIINNNPNNNTNTNTKSILTIQTNRVISPTKRVTFSSPNKTDNYIYSPTTQDTRFNTMNNNNNNNNNYSVSLNSNSYNKNQKVFHNHNKTLSLLSDSSNNTISSCSNSSAFAKRKFKFKYFQTNIEKPFFQKLNLNHNTQNYKDVKSKYSTDFSTVINNSNSLSSTFSPNKDKFDQRQLEIMTKTIWDKIAEVTEEKRQLKLENGDLIREHSQISQLLERCIEDLNFDVTYLEKKYKNNKSQEVKYELKHEFKKIRQMYQRLTYILDNCGITKKLFEESLKPKDNKNIKGKIKEKKKLRLKLGYTPLEKTVSNKIKSISTVEE